MADEDAAEVRQRTHFDNLSMDELEWAHAQLSLIRADLMPVANNLMTQTEQPVREAGKDVMKIVQKVEGRMTMMQAQIRRLKVPDEGDPAAE